MAMTLQEAFNASYIGVIKQGKKSVDTAGESLYNDGQGCRCGIGQTMPKDTNLMDRNGDSINILVRDHHPAIAHLTHIDRDILIEFQHCHDGAEIGKTFISEFKQNMNLFAQKYHLTIPTIQG